LDVSQGRGLGLHFAHNPLIPLRRISYQFATFRRKFKALYRNHNPRVGGSSPSSATIKPLDI
jgi:hypothetical protein